MRQSIVHSYGYCLFCSIYGSLTRVREQSIRISGTLKLLEVYFTRDLKYNFLSVLVMTKKGVKVILGKNDSYIEKMEPK